MSKVLPFRRPAETARNERILMRIRGVPAQKGTPETDAELEKLQPSEGSKR